MKVLIFLAMLSLIGDAKGKEKFAVECDGEAKSTSTISGQFRENVQELGRQVFVIDIAEENVFRALFPRQEFDPVCAGKNDNSFSSISPGLIQVDSYNDFETDPHNTCDFKLDRMSGKGTHVLRMEWADGRFHEFEWTFDCVKTEIPVFDILNRKF